MAQTMAQAAVNFNAVARKIKNCSPGTDFLAKLRVRE
jgi:hypothetical protein